MGLILFFLAADYDGLSPELFFLITTLENHIALEMRSLGLDW